ncbi:hypothetical protein [Mycolicibacterium vulneris]|uniref:hypothetical protein n=1 Tax=Mycolicibacterium vulneris TaxID=547163 RepID=UPI0010562FCF|nr:hypothetical protein [Mycolicibacterium vulneris]
MRAKLPLVKRVAMNVDRAAVQRAEQERAAQATAERIAFLYGRLFGNVSLGSIAAGLRAEDAALQAFGGAVDQANNLLQVEILRVAIDKRWTSVVKAFIKIYDGEHPIAATVQELWNLTNRRAPA